MDIPFDYNDNYDEQLEPRSGFPQEIPRNSKFKDKILLIRRDFRDGILAVPL
jgi:hypothetical protein